VVFIGIAQEKATEQNLDEEQAVSSSHMTSPDPRRRLGHGYRETAIPATDLHRLNTDLRPVASVKIREDPRLFLQSRSGA
jgi:hypothetical protein